MSKSIYDCPKCGTYATQTSVMGMYWRQCYNCDLKASIGSSKTEANDNWKKETKGIKKE